jgi:hypothetical protein
MHTRVRRFLFPCLATLGALAFAIACGEETTAIPDPDGGATARPDGGADTSTTETGAVDAPADAPVVVCPDVLPDDVTGMYVATTGTNTPSCGARATPCRSVTVGINRALVAKPARARVYVARGTYAEKVSLFADIEVIGGWEVAGTTWKRACVAPESAVVLRAPASSNVTVEAQSIGGEARLSLLTVESKPAAQVIAGESLYGVVAVGATTSLVMSDVLVTLGNAGAGGNGTKGGPGPLAPASCADGTGLPGADGSQGAGADFGAFDPTGYTPATAAAGEAASPGANGTAGGAGTCVTCGSCGLAPLCEFIPAAGPMACGKDGTPGCSGGPGQPGGPATGGGSSIAVYAWDANVTVKGGVIKSGDAGNGGIGGAGGAGAVPTKGAAGASTDTCVTACALDGMGVACVETKAAGIGGAAGGIGGASGASGAGGGGGGGSSIAIYQGGAGFVTTTGGASLAHGSAGRGGGPDAGAGTGGVAADRVP